MVRTYRTKLRQWNDKRGRLFLGLAFTGAVLVLAASFAYRQRDLLLHHLMTANRAQLPGITAWYTLDLAVYMAAWILVMHGLGARVSLLEHFRIFCLTNAIKRLPGILWYVGGRVVLYERVGVPRSVVLVASGLEFVLMVVSGALIAAPLLIVVLPNLLWLWVAGGALILLVVLNPRCLRWILGRTVQGWTASTVRLSRLYAWIMVYAAGWTLGGVLMLWILGIYQPTPIGQVPTVIQSWTLSCVLSMFASFLPASLGVNEASLTVLLTRLAPAAVAALAAISARVLITALDLVFGLVAALLGWGLDRR
jgi:hypothetical protein